MILNTKNELNHNTSINDADIAKNFDPNEIETKIYSQWEKNGYFRADFNKACENHGAYVIQSPPPNVTGTLHMGHAFNNTIIDILIRYNRMHGKDALLIPGTDHAGIATQIVVERNLEANNIFKNDLGREQFIQEIWKWKNRSKSNITNQIKRLGISADWSQEYFTMDDNFSKGVIETFVRLYNQGLIYKGTKMVNWDPKLLTAVSDLEVQYKEVNCSMYYIQYLFIDQNDEIIDQNGNKIKGILIATTRPETIFADTAICVHPDDSRYKHLIGKYVAIPLSNKKIKIISDNFVDKEFGTGCVKITGAHDFNDYECSKRHNLPLTCIFTKQAHLNDQVPEKFRGLDRYIARKKVIKELEDNNFLFKVSTYKTTVPIGDRSGVTLEPMLTNQWFVAVNKKTNFGSFYQKSLAEIALNVVSNNSIKFYPESWTKIYNKWLNNIQDWCISRQIWWGHQIPAWYSEDGKIFVARNEKEAEILAKEAGVVGKLRRDQDVLDTWFSSAIVPFISLKWPNNSEYLNKYFPSTILVTGFDIIFFWVTRMIMLTTYLTGNIPFHNVYIHGLIRDHEGQKMSKSKGNTIDPIDLIDGISLDKLIIKRTTGLMNPKLAEQIKKHTIKNFPNGIQSFGTDALRFTMASYASLGRDINFDIKRCEGYRNFCNKIWNATRFVLINRPKESLNFKYFEKNKLSFIDNWILSELQYLKLEIKKGFEDNRLDNVANSIYKFIWEEYCDWYLECAKIQLKIGDKNTILATYFTLITVLEEILRLLHPIMPYITEELWQKVIHNINGTKNTSICIQEYPVFQEKNLDQLSINKMLMLKKYVESIRILRSKMNISPAQKISAFIETEDTNNLEIYKNYIISLSKLSSLDIVNDLPNNDSIVHVIEKNRIMLDIKINIFDEMLKIEKEIFDIQNIISKIHEKLNNINFIKKAPKNIIDKEKMLLEKNLLLLNKLKYQYSVYKNQEN
ncbi:Valine--tRNA ligase [Candidatus Kinetoplastibacterium sorsogonicusi]|uniref:Valine--tRNA ligase n=1 Tax=Candidatus Kinetoplastidibacterium kentomonadis TaxID=1576550 RepID=A0A3Q8ERM1_9PROT|nr:valine--tRNA ligase [Candidatus Kinetoplastibacterium sorsogonicusi]AWD32497.1 Valine--tRNA ligase [Candidatus Kinetoplastibacterium sorsogonicusi]